MDTTKKMITLTLTQHRMAVVGFRKALERKRRI